MSDEQPTSGTGTNPAADVHAPRQATPVMDVVPPPAEPAVVAAPPEESAVPAMSDDLAKQLAADTTTPPVPAEAPVETPATAEAPAPTPASSEGAPEAKPAEQTSAVHDELKKQQDVQEAIQKLPKAVNPGRKAAMITVAATALLAILAVFAYMSTKK